MSSKYYFDFVFSGFGGQGILIAGNLLCYSAILENREVTFFPSYGVEMRGGSANCYVVLSDSQIGSPIPSHPMGSIIMSTPALIRFLPIIKNNGLVLINSDIISTDDINRKDLDIRLIPANKLSIDVIGNERLANMVMLGYLVSATKCVKIESLVKSIKEVVSEKHKKLIPLNEKAILAGAELFEKDKRC
ncbi:MAG: 2-oxoacid:acceptor oxidoreductase family protein [Proteobacteria bacterium]|nr:2-oxoacid:acceptor oxidoreductase family protein [Pseudomonadota bacterium]